MRYPAVIFDLDGTLLDTIEDITDSFNEVLAAHGHPTHTVAYFRSIVGHGAADAARKVLPPDRLEEGYVSQLLAEYEALYQRNNGLKTRPFPGIVALLQRLAREQIRLAVLSNKPDAATQESLARQLPHVRFDVACGHRSGAALKPDPSVALEIARELNVPASQIAFVGDSAIDVQTALAAGMQPIGVTWGYRCEEQIRLAGACRIAHSAEALAALLLPP